MGSSRRFDFQIITAILSIEDIIIMAAKSPVKSWFFPKPFSLYQYLENSRPKKIFDDYKNIPDMAMVNANSFAFIDQGVWTSSHIHLVKLNIRRGYPYWQDYFLFSTESKCCGIAVTEDHFFLTFSGQFKRGYVKMLDLEGGLLTKFEVNREGSLLFSNTLSKIYVDPDYRMYVSDVGKQQLIVMTVSSIELRAEVVAEYNNITAKSIIPKGNEELFIAVGGNKKEVIVHSEHGQNKVIPQNKLEGTPTALCLVRGRLYVATMQIGWFSIQTRLAAFTTQTGLAAFKDKSKKRKEKHHISLFSTQTRIAVFKDNRGVRREEDVTTCIATQTRNGDFMSNRGIRREEHVISM